MSPPKKGTGRARRFVKPMLNRFLPVCYKIFPPSRNLIRYRETFGHFPNVIWPRKFTERVERKILFDRNPRLRIFADKLRVREYVESRLGGGQYLTRQYAVVENGAEISKLDLPTKFVMKPNHLSNAWKIVFDSSALLPGELEGLATRWLKLNFYDVTQEWAYKDIKPRVIFEELLEVDGHVPDDYKFFCFDGEPRFLYVARGRLSTLRLNFYDLNLAQLPVRQAGYPNFHEEIKAPPNFDKMVEVARLLSAGVDFVRVDLYNVKGRIVFGELTNYHSNGRARFEPPEWDLRFGSYWR